MLKRIAITTAFVAASAMLVAVGSASASACKGLEQAACGKKSDCTWVEGYKRKDGAKVSGYCRTKSGGSKKTSANDTKKAK
jgi:hypothetical protein